MPNIKELPILLGALEVVFGIASAVLYSMVGSTSSKHSYNILAGIGCTSGLVPLLMRWSVKFWNGSNLEKIPELVLCIWSAVCFLIGGVLMIMIHGDNSGTDTAFAVAAAAIAVGIIIIVDLVLGLKGR